ncbi:hypothetical protein C8N24_1555 [Solirubrobacter pauli]|uniref:Hemolysin type calcium-binding protein n=1 Tax=Solirubrobacter pauli TaxID=166793 RepID=A0A660L9H4_9ACTN|nr:hypothetical protein [Solirubrobacter pauli]RKQ91727.1 hypothetical protein C8N24_1555 [Solirubrobacter pauli]
MRVTAVLILGWFVLFAAPARAAKVGVDASCGKENCVYYVVFTAAPGERNVVTTEEPAETLAVLRDTGAPLTAGRGCSLQGDGSARCDVSAYATYVSLVVKLGDGDDVAAGEGSFDGGPGNDRITGNGTGGPGNDVLMNQHGYFVDDDGPTRGHDVYRSWDGQGIVSYETRRTGVLVDLRPQSRSEDRLEGIREVRGGLADDVLIGDDGPNRLIGGPGADRLLGNGGDDWLTTGRSDDRVRAEVVDAGPGDDRINAGSSRGAVRCGSGADVVEAGALTVLRPDCDAVAVSGGVIGVQAGVATPSAAFATGLAGEWRARFRDRVVASARGSSGAALALNTAGQRLLRRNGQLVLSIEHGAKRRPAFRLRVQWVR